jgi:hypothetical protein
MENAINYTDKREQVYIAIDKDGYLTRLKIRNNTQKQQMYNDYSFVIQVGFRCRYMLKIWFNGGSFRYLNPNKYRINDRSFISRNVINTISLEVEQEDE